MSATLPNTTALALLEYCKQNGDGADLSGRIGQAVDAWLAARAAARQENADAPVRG